jgi:hypothetical protein
VLCVKPGDFMLRSERTSIRIATVQLWCGGEFTCRPLKRSSTVLREIYERPERPNPIDCGSLLTLRPDRSE